MFCVRTMFSQITRRLNCSSAQQGCIIVMVSRQEVSTAPPRLPLSSHPITIKPSSTNIIQALNLFWNGIDHAVRYWITKLNYPSTRPAPLYGKPGAASCGSSTRSLYRGVSDLPACRSAALPPSVARPTKPPPAAATLLRLRRGLPGTERGLTG